MHIDSRKATRAFILAGVLFVLVSLIYIATAFAAPAKTPSPLYLPGMSITSGSTAPQPALIEPTVMSIYGEQVTSHTRDTDADDYQVGHARLNDNSQPRKTPPAYLTPDSDYRDGYYTDGYYNDGYYHDGYYQDGHYYSYGNDGYYRDGYYTGYRGYSYYYDGNYQEDYNYLPQYNGEPNARYYRYGYYDQRGDYIYSALPYYRDGRPPRD